MKKTVILLFALFLFVIGNTGVFAASVTNVADTVNGIIWDFKDNRILFLDSSLALKIKDRNTGEITTVLAGKTPRSGYLTPKGAVFLEQSGDGSTAVLYEWRDGQLVNVGHADASFILKGNYVAYKDGTTIYLRDLTSGVSSVVTTNAGDSGFDIADNGQIVWSDKDSYKIYAYLSGVTSQITSTTDKKNLSPLTDGSSILFARVSASASLPVQLVVSFKDPYTGAAKESAFYTSDKAMVPNVDYAIHRGEVYYHFKNSGSDKIFIFWINAERCGCEGSVPDQGDSIGSILSISPGGHLIYSTANNVYYYPRPNGHNIKSSLPIDPEAKIFWSGNDPYASEGGTLYQIVIGINDNVPPVTTINGTDGQWTNTRSFTFTATDDSSGVMWTYLTFLDMDHSSSVINVPRDGNKFTFQADGHYRVVYQSRDWSGNMDDEKGIDLWVDATVPVTTYTTAPIYASDKGATYIKGYTVTLNASDNMSGVKQTFYRINNGAWKLYTTPFELSGTSNMSLDFYSVDNAGNVEAY